MVKRASCHFVRKQYCKEHDWKMRFTIFSQKINRVEGIATL